MRPPLTPVQQTKEMVDRLRRIETRLTRFMEWSGFDTDIKRPIWSNGTLDLPNDAQSLRDCLASIPADWRGDVSVCVKGQIVAVLHRLT
jgi:hypothetical protein